MVIMGHMLMLEWVLVLLLASVVTANLAEQLAAPLPVTARHRRRRTRLLAVRAANPHRIWACISCS